MTKPAIRSAWLSLEGEWLYIVEWFGHQSTPMPWPMAVATLRTLLLAGEKLARFS